MLFNNDEVKSFLPHRDPFLFIDSVKEVTLPPGVNEDGANLALKDCLGATVTAFFHAKKDLDIFSGHFPGNPVLPGVIQVEMMAQASCFMSSKVYKDPEKFKLEVALMGASHCKFRKPVLPDMNLTIKAKLVKVRGPVISYDGEIYHGDTLMSEASLLASVKFIERDS